MFLKNILIIMALSAVLLGGAITARAELQPPEDVAACESSPPGQIAIALAPEDNDGLALASAFREHLELQGKDPAIVDALYKASMSTGVDFRLLLLKAIMESDLGRFSAAAQTSARGVFQYIEPTWLILISRHGTQLGYPHYQDAVRISPKTGNPYLKKRDAFLRPEILALRHDPEASAMMKAFQIQDETEIIRSYKHSKAPTPTDHYIAHMLGLKLARDFYDMMDKGSPMALARLNQPEMREAARLNRQFFFSRGKALQAGDVYKRFDARVKQELASIDKVGATPYDPPCSTVRTAAFH